jgi:glutamyl-tRNA synthetase
LEGVTHACRSKEYNERDEQYKLVWDIVCKGKKKPGSDEEYQLPEIYQFSRLDFKRTILSKRKLTVLVERGVVDGWDDPRMPTVQGMFRRGVQLEALRAFVLDQALSKRNNLQEWDKFWTYNKKVLDPEVSRFYAVGNDHRTTLRLMNVTSRICKRVQLHPKDESKGYKTMELGSEIWLDGFEASNLIEKFNARKDKSKPFRFALMSFGIVHLSEIADGGVLVGDYKADDKNFKKIPILTWVCGNADAVPVSLVELDYLFDSEGGETTTDTWQTTSAVAESGISLLSKGDIVQFMKRGFYVVDKPYLGRPDSPAVMIFIPDGKSKAMSKLSAAVSKVEITTR